MRRREPLDQRFRQPFRVWTPEDTERLNKKKKDKMATGPDTFFSLF